MIQRKQNTGMIASFPWIESAHGAVSGLVEELAVTGQGACKTAAEPAGTAAHPAPSQTVFNAQAGEARGFEKSADEAEKAQLDFARVAPRRQARPFQAAVEHYRSEEHRVGKECRSRWS